MAASPLPPEPVLARAAYPALAADGRALGFARRRGRGYLLGSTAPPGGSAAAARAQGVRWWRRESVTPWVRQLPRWATMPRSRYTFSYLSFSFACLLPACRPPVLTGVYLETIPPSLCTGPSDSTGPSPTHASMRVVLSDTRDR